MVALSQLGKWLEETHDKKVLSVYLDPRAPNPADRFGWSSKLQRGLTEMELELKGRGLDSEEGELRAAGVMLRKALADLDISSAPGFVAFVRPGEVLHAEHTTGSTSDLVFWEDGIHVAPLLAASTSDEPIVITVVSSREASIYRSQRGVLRRDDSVHLGHHEGQFYHMGSVPAQGFHMGTRGETGTDAAQRAQHSALLHMVRRLADQLDILSRPNSPIVIGGTPEAAREAFDALSPGAMLRAKVAPDLNVSADESTIARVAAHVAAELRAEAQQSLIAEMTDVASAHGKAALGLDAIRGALGASAVHQVCISPTFIAMHAHEAEALVRAAIAERAKIIVVEGAAIDALNSVGGLVAQLRFVPALAS